MFAWSSATGKLTLVTSNYERTGPASDPDPQQYGTAENISISANGDYIAYDSEATDLVPSEKNINYTPDVYVYDLLTGKNILVSAADSGGGIGNGSSDDPVISSDGSTVAYDSLAGNLDPSHGNLGLFENYQVYASTLNYTTDTVSGTTLLSVDSAGNSEGNGTSIAPSLSDNGQLIAFQSASTNLVSTSNGGSYNDIYVRNLSTKTTRLASINDAGTATGSSSSFAPQLSGDGTHVLFYSLASDLTSTPAETETNVFERDLTTSTTQMVSVDYEGTASANDTSTLANQTMKESAQQATGQISDNGQYVVFRSVATNLVPSFQQENGGSPYGTDVYIRNMASGTTTLLSHASGTTTTGGTGISTDTDMTSSGLDIVFQSAFSGDPDNMVPSDTNGQTQLYDASFGSLPGATTEAATSITTSGAKLNASVNPGGSATTYDFVYGTSSSLSSGTTTTASESAGSGTSAISESAALSGLNPATTYYFEVEATDSAGTNDGSILSFTTSAPPMAPAATTDAASSITSTGVKLNASVNPKGSATSYDFVYGTSSSLSSGTITTTSASAGSGTSAVSESAALAGLTPHTTYYFEVKATNSVGTTTESILSFTTLAPSGTPPAATTEAAGSITSTGATLGASVIPKGGATNYSFIYGTSSTLSSGATITTAKSAGGGTSAVSETAALTGLTLHTTYYFTVVASNSGGTTDGSILSFTTLAVTPPTAATVAAASVTATGATLEASINPEGNAATYSFVYGTNPSLSSPTIATTAESAGSGTSALTRSAALSGLTPGTTYYFEVKATNSGGTTTGSILSFTTPAVIQFSTAAFIANVTAGSAQVVVTRTGGESSTFTVMLQSPGGQDVAPFTREITLGPNEPSATVSIAIVNNGLPGESNTVIPLSLSSPVGGAVLGAAATASLVLIDDNPALVTITSLAHEAIKVGSGRKAKKETVLELQFSGPVTGAGSLGAYVIESGKTKKGKTTYNKPVPLTSAAYEYLGTPPHTVTLFLKNKLNLSLPEQLTVNGSLMTDSDGRPLPESIVVQFSKKGVTIS